MPVNAMTVPKSNIPEGKNKYSSVYALASDLPDDCAIKFPVRSSSTASYIIKQLGPNWRQRTVRRNGHMTAWVWRAGHGRGRPRKIRK